VKRPLRTLSHEAQANSRALEAQPKTQASSVAPEPGIKRQSRKQGADVYGDGRLGVVAVSHEAGPGRHQGQIGDGGGHKELEEGLGTTEE
jgi:hypothetical protein